VPKPVNLKSLAVVVNADEGGVTAVGGAGGAAREVLVMLFSMDRNEGHVVAFTMLL
jgi:shikimate 5-dehydrogenase